MYVQPPDRGAQRAPLSDVIVPKNYSGNAFRQYSRDSEAEPPVSPPVSDLPSPDQPPDLAPELPPDEAPVTDAAEQDSEAVAAWKNDDRDEKYRENGHTGGDHDHPHRHADEAEKRSGFFSRFPFLSSLLPPPRGKHKKDGALPEWVVIAAVILLFFSEDADNDILPFLLLLLLWD